MGDATSTKETTVFTLEHAVVINSLSTSTKYYYMVSSKDRNGNNSEDNNSGSYYNFTTRSPSISTTTVNNTVYTTTTIYQGGGGGGDVIDNRDLSSPLICGIKINQVGLTSANIFFVTSKIANGVINFGTDSKYGFSAGDPDIFLRNHKVSLDNLLARGTYHFKISAKDVYGNSAQSSDGTFILGDADQIKKVILHYKSDIISLLKKKKNARPRPLPPTRISLSRTR